MLSYKCLFLPYLTSRERERERERRAVKKAPFKVFQKSILHLNSFSIFIDIFIVLFILLSSTYIDLGH